MYRIILVAFILFSESKGFIFPEIQTESIRRQRSFLSNSYWGEQDLDFDGFSEKLQLAYEDWCQTYGENFSSSRMEVFSYHFMVAENYSRRTGVNVKLNQFAGLTQPEIEHAMGGINDDIERPIGAEFLDYELEEESSPLLTSTDLIDPTRDHDPLQGYNDFGSGPPKGFNGFGFNKQDKIARETNAFLEEMGKESIVPPAETNLFKEINESILEKESISLDKVDENLNEAPSEEASEPVDEGKNEGTDLIDEGTLMFLSYIDRLSREKGLTKDSTMDEDTASTTKPKSPSNSEENKPIQDVIIAETADSNPSDVDNVAGMDSRDFNPEEVYYFAGSPTPMNEVKPEPSATPMAREAAKRANLDLSLIQGTGKDGRITLHDVEVARDGMPQSPEDVWEERIRNGPFQQASHGFYADPTPSTFDNGSDSIDAPTGYPTDEYRSNSNDFRGSKEYQEQGPDPSQEIFHRHEESEAFQEDPNAKYDMQDGTSRPDQRYRVDVHIDENRDTHAEDKFQQELGDPSNQFNPQRSDGFNGSTGSPECENVDPPLDSLDERVERASHEDLGSVSQQASEPSEEPQSSRQPSLNEDLADFQVHGDLRERLLDPTLDGPIASHNVDNVRHIRSEDSLNDDEAVATSSEASNLKGDEVLEKEPKTRIEETARSKEELTLHQERDAEEKGGEEEEFISTSWAEEEPEDEHFDPPDWVVGNAEPLVPPHLSGAERVTGNFKIDTVASTKGDDKASKAGEPPVLVDNAPSRERDNVMELVDTPPERTSRRVSSARNPDQSPVFLDSVTSEAVEGDQVQLPELTFWMSEAKIQKWSKKVGDPVHVGETLMVVVCDTKISKETLEWSATQDVKATSNGFLVAKHFGTGDMISKGWTIGVIGTSTDGLTTVDPEPIISYIEEDGTTEEDETRKKPKRVIKSGSPQKKKKVKETVMRAKGGEQSKVKKKKSNVQKKSQPSRQKNKEQVRAERQTQKQKVQEGAPKKSGWKSSPTVSWEPNRMKMDGLNHVLIPFLQSKIEAWERKSKFQLPATSSLEQEVLSSSKNKMTIRWEPRRNGKEQKKSRGERLKKLQNHHGFASLPAVSWQFEKSQIPSESNPTNKEKRTRQIFFLEPKAGVSKKRHGRQRLGLKTQWNSFPKLIKWESVTHPLPPRRSQQSETIDEIDGGLAIQKMVYATPMARAAARMANLDLQHISGSGVGGRVTLDDVKDVLYPMLLEEQDRRQNQQLLQQQVEEEHDPQESKSSLTVTPHLQIFQKSIRIRPLRVPYASPLARKLAEEHEMDLGTLTGSGPRGRILLEDVQKVLARQPEE